MRSHRRPAASTVTASLVLAACGGADEHATQITAATLGAQTVRPAADYLGMPPYAAASAAQGNRLLLQCRSCHNLESGAGHTLGPNLHGILGRRAGAAEAFAYSPALVNAGFVWTPRALDAWLADPTRFLPGNAMLFPGIRDVEDRAALIAALLRQSSTPDWSPPPADSDRASAATRREKPQRQR